MTCDSLTGVVQIELIGQWLEAFKHMRGRKNVIYTSLYEGHVFASCMLPVSLFEGD